MVALLVGIVFIAFAIYSVLPVSWSLDWWAYVLDFLRGGVPIIAVFTGLIAVFIGIADIKDRMEAKREEAEEAAAEKEAAKKDTES
jgi:TRAP-type C4-dicarboxylate transport system permease small subunit